MSDQPIDPVATLAAGFGEHLARRARAAGDDEDAAAELQRVGAALVRAEADGHVALPAPAWAGTDAQAARRIATLRASVAVDASPAVAGGDRSRPLVLDADSRLYLQRNHEHECALARRLARAAGPGDAPGAEPTGDPVTDALACGRRQRLLVVSGGPGTGKTTLAAHLLDAWLTAEPGLRVALAAPTGKAAARLTQALRGRIVAAPGAPETPAPLEARTVHRLLGLAPDGRSRHGAHRPLAADVLLVDEASMLDLALARRLFDAVPESARIVCLGDRHQLAAVEAGAVFAALAALPQAIELTRNHRFAADSGIAALAADIRDGRADEAVRRLERAGASGGDLAWLEVDDRAAGAHPALAAACEGWTPYLDAVGRPGVDPVAALAALQGFVALAAQREGRAGVRAINAAVEAHARARPGAAGGPAAGAWFAGRPVIVLRNDAATGLFNGDVGVALPAPGVSGLQVWFADAGGSVRAFTPSRLPPHETAFAITVHRAQGSEAARVLVALPPPPSPMLTRELLYTAVTRARGAVVLAASEASVRDAARRPTPRHSGLAARWSEALAAPR